MSNTQLTEEPDAPKGARPVWEARQVGDSLSLASGLVIQAQSPREGNPPSELSARFEKRCRLYSYRQV